VVGLSLVDSSYPFFELSLTAVQPTSASDTERTKFCREWFSNVSRDPSMQPEYFKAGSLGDLPLIVLTAPNKTRAEDFPEDLNDRLNQI
jgi:hypothetical protein